MTIKNVAIIGANGNLGPFVLQALNDADGFNTTVISRKNSKSTYPASQNVKYVSEDLTLEELTDALRGQDAIVATLMGTNDELQKRLADACVEAGVKRFIPADFGSCDSTSKLALDLMPLYRAKTRVREHLQQLADSGKLSWTAIVCGHFFARSMMEEMYRVDLEKNSMRIFGDGEYRFSTTTLERVGQVVVKVLQNEDVAQNKMIYVQSFCITQNELRKSLEQAAGRKFDVETVEVEPFIKEMKQRTDQDNNDRDAREGLVSVVGIIDGNWTEKPNFANQLLGLEEENLDAAVSKVFHG